MTAKEARQQRMGGKLSKDEKRSAAAERRAERERVAAGHDRGDPLFDKYHMPRDRGPERLLVRDVVDSRRTVGQYFFIIAFVMILLNGQQMPPVVQAVALFGWVGLLLLFALDSVLLCRRVGRIVRERFPKTTQRKGGLYWYAISRSIMFRRLRMPRPRPHLKYGMKPDELGKTVRN